MLIRKFTKEHSNIIEEADLVIIGSGLASVLLALKLDRKKFKVAILEKGAYNCSLERPYETGMFFGLPNTHCLGIGGTSNLWANVLTQLDEYDFSHWPLSYEQLKVFYKEATHILGGKFASSTEIITLLSDKQEFNSSEPVNYKAKFFQQPKRVKRASDFFPKISDNVNLFYEIEVEELHYLNGKIKSLTAYTNEENIKLDTKSVVLAAGALGSPAIMLNSPTLINSLSLKKKDCLVGKYLSDHPMGNVGQLKLASKLDIGIFNRLKLSDGSKIKAGLIKDKLNDGQPNHNFYHIPSFLEGYDDKSEAIKRSLLSAFNKKPSFKDIYNILLFPRVSFSIITYFTNLRKKFSLYDLWFVCDQIPQKENKVYLTEETKRSGYKKAAIYWSLSEEDIISLKTFLAELKEHHPLVRHNHAQIINIPSEEILIERLTSAAHHFGSLKMGNSLDDGIVDKNLKCFNVENLWVSDASVIPYSGNSNINLTICALALYLANHLSQQ